MIKLREDSVILIILKSSSVFDTDLDSEVVPNEESPIGQSDHVARALEVPPAAVGRRNPLDTFAVRSVDVDLKQKYLKVQTG